MISRLLCRLLGHSWAPISMGKMCRRCGCLHLLFITGDVQFTDEAWDELYQEFMEGQL